MSQNQHAYRTAKQQPLYSLVREWKLEGRKFTQGAIAVELGTHSSRVHIWMSQLEQWGWIKLSDIPCRKNYSDHISIVRELLYLELHELYEYEKDRADKLEKELEQLRGLLKRRAA